MDPRLCEYCMDVAERWAEFYGFRRGYRMISEISGLLGPLPGFLKYDALGLWVSTWREGPAHPETVALFDKADEVSADLVLDRVLGRVLPALELAAARQAATTENGKFELYCRVADLCSQAKADGYISDFDYSGPLRGLAKRVDDLLHDMEPLLSRGNLWLNGKMGDGRWMRLLAAGPIFDALRGSLPPPTGDRSPWPHEMRLPLREPVSWRPEPPAWGKALDKYGRRVDWPSMHDQVRLAPLRWMGGWGWWCSSFEPDCGIPPIIWS